jgi:hypothetical protein
MRHLLVRCDETHWLSWIDEDIQAWRSDRSTAHHLSAYGGMGSFNDLTLCRQNSHNVSTEQQPWVSALQQDLLAVCYHLAKHGGRLGLIEDLEASMGAARHPLQGIRCLRCGYSEVTPTDIDYYLAHRSTRQGILAALRNGLLLSFVESVLALNIEGLQRSRSDVRELVERSDITFREREGWLDNCPRCGASDTAVYRWRIAGSSFEPSEDNLPLKVN